MKPQVLIGSPTSGSGKTTFALGLLRVMQRKGISVQPFKCGPDFIDTFYHSIACGRDSVNLDTWLSSKSHVQCLYNTYADRTDACVLDGNMGLFDGYSRMKGSSAEIAHLLNVPIVMIVNARTMGYSAAPILYGFKHFRPSTRIVGVIYNQITSPAQFTALREACIDSGIECLGYLPADETLRLPNRHSAFTVDLRRSVKGIIEQTADLLEKHVDWKKLLSLCMGIFPCPYSLPYQSTDIEIGPMLHSRKLKIAIARDSAFCFLYRENIDSLTKKGIVSFFSPLYANDLPDVDLIYIPGGYPELFARQLHRRKRFLQQLKDFAEDGGMILTEGSGGVLLSHSLMVKQSGTTYYMANVLPLDCTVTTKAGIGYSKQNLDGTILRGYEYSHIKADNIPPVYRYKNVVVSQPHWYWGETDLSKLWE